MTALISPAWAATGVEALLDDRAWLRAMLRVNPMTPFVVAYQDIFFFGRVPNLSDAILIVAYAGTSLVMGFFVFDRLRDTLAEEV